MLGWLHLHAPMSMPVIHSFNSPESWQASSGCGAGWSTRRYGEHSDDAMMSAVILSSTIAAQQDGGGDPDDCGGRVGARFLWQGFWIKWFALRLPRRRCMPDVITGLSPLLLARRASSLFPPYWPACRPRYAHHLLAAVTSLLYGFMCGSSRYFVASAERRRFDRSCA